MLIREPVNNQVRPNSKILSPRNGRDIKDLLTGNYDGMVVTLIGSRVNFRPSDRDGRININMIAAMDYETILGSGWRELQWRGDYHPSNSPKPVKQFKY